MNHQDVVARVQRRIAEDPGLADSASLASLVRQEAHGVISDVDMISLLRQLRYDSVGIGQLERLLVIPGVTDIVVNGTTGVWFDRGQGLERADVAFASDDEVRRLATRFLVASGSRLDHSHCFGDGRITRDDATSIRVHAVLSPPSESGTCLSLRVLRQATTTIKQLTATGTFSPEVAGGLQEMIALRKPFLVIGGTGSGKTTLLSALLAQVDPGERIVCIEDTAELRPAHPHVVSLVSRAKNTEGSGEITMTTLLRQALRMRPDRIVLGEIRGPEVVDLLAALNTGHEGCAGTLHANSLQEVPARIEALAALGGLDRQALHSQLAAASPVVLAMKRTRQGRRLQQIGVLRGYPLEVHLVWDDTMQGAPSWNLS